MNFSHIIKFKNPVVYKYQGGVPDDIIILDGLNWVMATNENIERYFSKSNQSMKSKLKNFLKMGAYGIIIHDGREWVTRGFLSPPNVYLPKYIPRRIAKNSWCYFWMHTKTEWRGRGLHNTMIRLGLNFIFSTKQNGYDIIADTETWNIPSRKGFIRNGFKPYGMLFVVSTRISILKGNNIFSLWSKRIKHPPIEESSEHSIGK